MKPGRELDALVAEKVMGWHRKHFAGGGGGFTAYVDEEGKIQKFSEHPPINFCSCEVFSPSADISDAWRVVEKLGIIPNSFYIGYKTDKNGKKIYRAFFQKENPITTLIHTYEADAETAPLAICLAALKAVGVDVE